MGNSESKPEPKPNTGGGNGNGPGNTGGNTSGPIQIPESQSIGQMPIQMQINQGPICQQEISRVGKSSE